MIRRTGLNELDLPLALFLFSAALGVWPAHDRSLCWDTLIALTAGCLLYGLISRSATSRRRWRAWAALIVLVSACLSLYFVTQYHHLGYPAKVGPINRLGALVGRIVPPVATWAPMANGVATFLEGPLFLALALTASARRRPWRAGGVIGAALIGLALLMSASRGAWLAVVVGSALWSALHWRPARAIVVLGAILALGLVGYVIVQGDVAALEDVPLVNRTLAPLFIRPDRLGVYRNSVYLIQDFPLTGIGLGKQFAMVYARYALLIQHPFLTYSHNLYLETWLEQGLVGMVALLWLMTALYQAARPRVRPGADLLYQSTWLGLTAIFVHGLSDARLYEDLWCWFPFFGLLGLNGAVLLRRAPAAAGRKQWLLPAGVAGAFLLVVALTLARPVKATGHANQGCTLQARGELSPSLEQEQRAALRRRAMDQYRRAIQLAPSDRTARQRLGLMLIEQARFQAGAEHLEAAWRADPANTTTRKALGLAYVWIGELEQAKPLLQDVPDIVYELNIWGWWRGTQQQVEQSIHTYRMSLLLDPDQPEIRARLAQLERDSSP